jgi:hypothetical protein
MDSGALSKKGPDSVSVKQTVESAYPVPSYLSDVVLKGWIEMPGIDPD